MARKKDKKKKKDEELGWDAEDAEEAKEAEALLGTDMDEGRVVLEDKDKSTVGIETYDEDTGKKEGVIILKDGNTEGLLAQVRIVEQVGVEQDHNAEVKTISFSGKLEVENPSTVDRLWDIDISLTGTEVTNLESSQISIRELGTTDEDRKYEQEFQITGEAKNLLLIKEYINTLPDADSILNITDIEKDLDSLKEKKSQPEITEASTTSEEEEGEIKEEESKDSEEIEDKNEEEEKSDDYEEDGGIEAEQYSLESFAISIEKETTVYFAIAMKSLFEKPITNVKVVKTIPDDFTNPNIISNTIGKAEIEGNQIIWTIEELEPEQIVMLKFTMDIFADSIESRKTGLIEVTYEAKSSFAGGLAIEKFDAYTRNRFYVDTIERDEEPGVWDCKLVFENTSEFIIQLFNADVYAPEDETKKLVDIDPNDVPQLPADARWESVPWVYESDDYPSFRKKLEFRVMPDFQTIVNGTITIEDVELSVASITGDVIYSIAEITEETERGVAEEGEIQVITVPTYKEKDVNASLKLENDGSAPLNEIVVIQQYFSDEFMPPIVEEIQVIIDGNQIELSEEAVIIENNILKIELKNLSEGIGMFEPGSVMEIKYPIHCNNPPQDARFESEIIYLANTLPVSQELEFKPVVPVIEAIHIRRKFRIGKEVVPIGELGEYQIILTVENIGNSPLQNLVLLDKVPDSFEYGEYSLEPAVTDEVGADTLKWTIEKLEEGEKLEITYKIKGSGDYRPSEAQLAL
ncbi:MAG: hypothetical protein ACP6IY_03435 [Promethearchaeia archaeon]